MLAVYWRIYPWLGLNQFNSQYIVYISQWTSYQIRKIVGCACAGNAGNVFPTRRFQRKPLVSDPGMHHGTCVTHVPWCMSGSFTCGGGENVRGIPGACAPAILRIWQEAHDTDLGMCILARTFPISQSTQWISIKSHTNRSNMCYRLKQQLKILLTIHSLFTLNHKHLWFVYK